MSAENAYDRIASAGDPQDLRGRTFLGRLKSVAGSGDAAGFGWTAPQGIDLFDTNSKDFTTPYRTVFVPGTFSGFDTGRSSQSGIPLDGMPCIVTFSDKGEISVDFSGLEWGFFKPDAFGGGWSLQTREDSGYALVVPGFITPPDPNGNGGAAGNTVWDGCSPILAGASPGGQMGGSIMLYRNWEAEWQACKGDDRYNDDPAGMRSPWNYLSSSCCVPLADEEGGDPFPDVSNGKPFPCGGGGGGGGGSCVDSALTCAVIVRQCHTGQGIFRFDYKMWCLIDGQNNCEQQTGGQCYCSNDALVGGGILPNAETQPTGTIAFVKCSNVPTGNPRPRCSTLDTNPNPFTPWCDP